MTGSVAENGTRLGAGNPNASSLFTRTAAGFQINQMVWDFGRVRAFAASLDARAEAMKEAATGARAEVLWRVRGTYFRALAAQTQLRVMAANLEARRLTMRQVKALTDSQLRSTLDLSFAELHVAEAEMAQLRAESEVRTAAVELAAAMGETEAREYTLADPGDPAGAVGAGVEEVVREAMEGRAELAALRQQARAATRFADSEKRQGLPMLTATGVAGMFGWRDANLRQRYGALAMNLNIPLFNGGQFKSRAAEADLRAESVRQELREMEVRVAREVRAAWVEGENARRRMALTGKVAPFFTHQVAWRAVVPGDPADPAEVEVHMGPGKHLVSYPLRGGAWRNIVAVEERRRWVEEGWSLRDDPLELRLAFEGFSPRVRDWLERVEDVWLWGLFRHEVARDWFRVLPGGVAGILGDAAHPTLPFLAQGANMALEDAAVMGRCLAASATPAEGFARFEALRWQRTADIVNRSRDNAKRFHNPQLADDAVAVAYVDREWQPESVRRRYDWLFEYGAHSARMP